MVFIVRLLLKLALCAAYVAAFRDCKVLEGVTREVKGKGGEDVLSSAENRDETSGPEALYFLDGLCFKTTAAKYFQVNVCPFHNVTQRRLSGSRETVSGIWGSWDTVPYASGASGKIAEGNEGAVVAGRGGAERAVEANTARELVVHQKMLFVGGDKCTGGEKRSATIELACIPASQYDEPITGQQYFPHADTPDVQDIHISCSAEGFSPASCGITCILSLPFPCEAVVGQLDLSQGARGVARVGVEGVGGAEEVPVGRAHVGAGLADSSAGATATLTTGAAGDSSDRRMSAGMAAGDTDAAARSRLRGASSAMVPDVGASTAAAATATATATATSTVAATQNQDERLERIEHMLSSMKAKLDSLYAAR
jgi:hypothetical protein